MMIRSGFRIILLLVLSMLPSSSTSSLPMLNEPLNANDDATSSTQIRSRRLGDTMLRRGAINHNHSGPGMIRGLSEKSGKGGRGGKGKRESDGKGGKGDKGKGKGKASNREDWSMAEHATLAPIDHTVVAEAAFPTPPPYTQYPTIEATTKAPTPVPVQEAVVLSQPHPPTPYPTVEPTTRDPTLAPVQEAVVLSQPPPPTPFPTVESTTRDPTLAPVQEAVVQSNPPPTTPYPTVVATTHEPTLAPVQEAIALSQPPPPTPYPTIETFKPTQPTIEEAITVSQPFPPTLQPTVESCDGYLADLETCLAVNDPTASFVSCEMCVKKVAGLVFTGFDTPFCDLSPGSVCNNLVACRFSGCVDSCLVHAYEYGSCELRRVCGYDFFDAASCPTN